MYGHIPRDSFVMLPIAGSVYWVGVRDTGLRFGSTASWAPVR